MSTATNTILLSKKGMKELRKSISKLEREQQQALRALRDLDKTDSHEGRLARSEKLAQLEIIESQLADKRLTLESAQLFPRKRDALKVALGSVVELIDLNGRVFRYTLVDTVEANPSDGRISIMSPLGKTLLGKTIKETIEWGSGHSIGKLQLISIR